MKRSFHLNNLFFTIGTLLLLIFITSCGGSKSTPEAALTVTTTPASGTVQTPSPGPFNLNVKITSAMPGKGVKIAISAAPDGSSTTFYTNTVNSTQASNDFSIANTPPATVSVVTIKVTSLSTPTNTWTGSYRYSLK
ncbi:hypothetical protein ACX0G9_18540 [Flavitalea flava]